MTSSEDALNSISTSGSTRREFMKTTGKLAAASALAGVSLPHVHAAESGTIQVALIGCGDRGTGAAADALSVQNGPIKLVAMADVFEKKLSSSHERLQQKFRPLGKTDVPSDRRYLGFDGYRKAMDCLRTGDVVILATPPAFRWVHFAYAIQKGLHVFMEKPVTVDGPTTKRMIALGKQAQEKNLKVGVGLMVRHCRGRRELKKRIDSGEIGDLLMMRAYRLLSHGGTCGPRPAGVSELLYQIDKFHSFLWASGGSFSDFNIHQIDECCWMKGAWPVRVHGTGGRHYRGNSPDQNFDNYSVEYTFEDGTKLFFDGRTMPRCHNEFSSYAHGTEGLAIVSTAGHTPGRVRTFKGHNVTRPSLLWAFPQPEPNPYQMEWDDLIEAIREDKPFNEVERGAMASLVTSMGRMAAHTGQIVTLEEAMKHPHEFAPDVDKLSMDSPAPLLADASGKYPVPMPGKKKNREY